MLKHWSDALVALGACEEAVEWARGQKDPEIAWQSCERADWMLWIAAMRCERRLVVHAALDCAETVAHLMPLAGLLALHVTREWCEGRADLEDVRDVRACARTAAAADVAADVAAAATYAAASDAAAAADADAAATYAAAAATYAAAAAAYAAAADRSTALRRMADIVRERVPHAP